MQTSAAGGSGHPDNADHHWNVVTRSSVDYGETQRSSSPHKFVSESKQPNNLEYSDDLVTWSVGKVMTSLNANDFDRALQTTIILNLALSCLVSFSRVAYLDLVTTLCIFWLNLDPQVRWTDSAYLYAILGILMLVRQITPINLTL